jgi:hypothetical protein
LGGGILLALFVTSVFVWAKDSAPISARDQRFDAGSRKFWASTGGPQGGDTLAMVSNANGYIFAGTLGGGVFRSTNNGETWTPANNGLTATDIRALATNSAGDVFAGTFGGVFVPRTTELPGRQLTTAWTIHSLSHSPSIPAETYSPGLSTAEVFTARPIRARTGRW